MKKNLRKSCVLKGLCVLWGGATLLKINFSRSILLRMLVTHFQKNSCKTLPVTSYEYTNMHLDEHSLFSKRNNNSYSWNLVHIQTCKLEKMLQTPQFKPHFYCSFFIWSERRRYLHLQLDPQDKTSLGRCKIFISYSVFIKQRLRIMLHYSKH